MKEKSGVDIGIDGSRGRPDIQQNQTIQGAASSIGDTLNSAGNVLGQFGRNEIKTLRRCFLMKRNFFFIAFSTTMVLGACSNATVTEETTPVAYSSLTDEELEKKVSKNDVDAILEKANRLYAEAEEKEKVTKSSRILQKAAESGNDIAQYHLGFAYMQGVGVDTNMEEACQWLFFISGTRQY